MAENLNVKDCMLTTVDNPYNPFTHFDEWLQFDQEKGYNTCELLSRNTYTSNELSESDNSNAIDEGMNEVVKNDPFGLYIKITKELAEKLSLK